MGPIRATATEVSPVTPAETLQDHFSRRPKVAEKGFLSLAATADAARSSATTTPKAAQAVGPEVLPVTD